MRTAAPQVRALVVLGLVCASAPAFAGGYDTPMLYSARHMGMGGTAIAGVEDPSALFHNPAGLGRVQNFAALADVSLLLARIKGTPNALIARDVESEQTVAPMFLLGAAHRIGRYLVAGVGVYPIASAGATYQYSFNDVPKDDTTRLVFLETSPALAVKLLQDRLRIGVGYRLTYVNLERYQGDSDRAAIGTDFTLTGWNAAGFRVGVQGDLGYGISAGAVYRHKVTTTVKNDRGTALSGAFTDVSTEFVLPSKLGGGLRADVGDFGLAVDGEYLFNSQNEGAPLAGTNAEGARIEVANVFEWSNELTLRTGLEYRFMMGLPTAGEPDDIKRLALRIGYVFDGKTTNEVFPSAFGTPPGPTHVLTAGLGWRLGRWQAALAYARRFGEGAVTDADIAAQAGRICRFCGGAGAEPYSIGVHGLYVDASYAF